MTDVRGTRIELGQEVAYVEVTRGSFRWRYGTVTDFTPQKVRIATRPRFEGGSIVEHLKQPEYVIVL